MIKPEKLSQDVTNLLLARLKDEFTAFYFYRDATNWCQNVGFFMAADYFKAESADELEHAKKIESYLTDWNISFDLPTILKTNSDFSDLGDIIEQAYKMEYALYEAYEEISSKIFKIGDLCVFDFLQFYRVTQKEAVAEYSDMINLLTGVATDNKFQMLLMEEKLFEKE